MQVLHIRGISGMGLQCLYQVASCFTMYNLESNLWERSYHELPDSRRQAVQYASGAPDRHAHFTTDPCTFVGQHGPFM